MTKPKHISISPSATEMHIVKRLKKIVTDFRSAIQNAIPPPGTFDPIERERRDAQHRETYPSPTEKQSLITIRMKDNAQTNKYFSQHLSKWDVTTHNRNVSLNLTQSVSSKICEIVINNELTDVYGLDKLDEQSREVILNRVVDKATFDNLISVCHRIAVEIQDMKRLRRAQFIHPKIKSVFTKNL